MDLFKFLRTQYYNRVMTGKVDVGGVPTDMPKESAIFDTDIDKFISFCRAYLTLNKIVLVGPTPGSIEMGVMLADSQRFPILADPIEQPKPQQQSWGITGGNFGGQGPLAPTPHWGFSTAESK